jgi:hypothetical protein
LRYSSKCFRRSCLIGLLWRCACFRNAHLRFVNSAFSSCARLKLAPIIQLPNPALNTILLEIKL